MGVASQSVSAKDLKKALSALRMSARQAHSFRLAAVAAQWTQASNSGAFDVVTKNIDNMMAQLRNEQDADNKKLDDCKQQYQKINLKKEDLKWKIENNDADIQTHKQAIDKKREEAKTIMGEIESADKQLKDMLSK